MNTEYIEKILKKILELLPENRRHDKALLLADSCSELSRLVASWIKDDFGNSHQTILKGDNVRNTDKSHDILASTIDNKIYVIDPTVWQFFSNESSILIGKASSPDEAIEIATKKYDGNWHESEELDKISPQEKEEWLRIVRANIKESR